MKGVIIILVLIVIGFAVAIGVGVARGHQAPSDSGGPPTRNGEIDQDALEDWKPPSLAQAMNTVAAPFAPKLLKTPIEIPLQADQAAGRLEVEASKKDMRVARLRLIAGSAAKVTYVCLPRDGRTCPQTVCLCALGSEFDADDVDDCPESWRKARTSGDGERLSCPADGHDDSASLVVYPEPGVISLEPLVSETATVRIR
jgi:hypothetical protein